MADRVWLDWQEPVVVSAARRLVAMSPTGGRAPCDLGDVLCVVPGRRAGRSLLAALVDAAAPRCLVPPRIVTPGLLAETLLPLGAIASRPERVLAWLKVLVDAGPDVNVIIAEPPPIDEVIAWHRIASLIADMHLETGREHVTFADLAEHADALLMHGEADRWRCLHTLAERYDAALADAGLTDPAVAERDTTARAASMPAQPVVLVGVPDLTAAQRRLLETIPGTITAMVAAPASMADRFDALGTVRTEAWADVRIPLDDERIVMAERPEDVAAAAFEGIAEQPADTITIGLADETLADTLRRVGHGAGVDVHVAAGRPLAASAPGLLLAAVHEHLREGAATTAAALLRHVDLEMHLEDACTPDDTLFAVSPAAAVDRYRAEHLPVRLAAPWPERSEEAAAFADALDRWLAPLGGAPRPLGEWSEPIAALLRAVYEPSLAGRTGEDAERLADACVLIGDAAAEIAAAHRSLQPEADGASAVGLLLAETAARAVPQDPRSGQVETLGWLELPLDPNPMLIIAGLEEDASAADPFLPDALRARAGLACAADRLARDAWGLTTILAVRDEVKIIVGRTRVDGEPSTPHRLLLACDDEQLAPRVRRFTDPTEPATHPWPGVPTAAAESGFVVPAVPADPPAPKHMAVTAFRDYLMCPYRFWLKRVERLRGVTDDAAELDALAFGTLAHEVLRVFGETPEVRDLTDAAAIDAFLVDTLKRETRKRYGRRSPAAVSVQVARLAQRLEAFASFQARHRAAGWRISAVEWKLPKDTVLIVPGQDPMPIRGTIDRIDVHEDDDATLVIDYKTSEKAKPPDDTHRRGDAWTDLQLPLYRHLLPADMIRGDVTLAYVALPRDPADVGLLPATWDDALHDDAIACAQDIVRAIRAGRYAINTDYPPQFHDDFETICQTAVFGGKETVDA